MNTEANIDAMRWENEDWLRFEKLAEDNGFEIEISEIGIYLCDEFGETSFHADWHEAWRVLQDMCGKGN